MDCSQYANCPSPPPHDALPFTGGVLELVVLVAFAIVCVSLALLIRYSERRA